MSGQTRSKAWIAQYHVSMALSMAVILPGQTCARECVQIRSDKETCVTQHRGVPTCRVAVLQQGINKQADQACS